MNLLQISNHEFDESCFKTISNIFVLNIDRI